jgi:hypothetical protein
LTTNVSAVGSTERESTSARSLFDAYARPPTIKWKSVGTEEALRWERPERERRNVVA